MAGIGLAVLAVAVYAVSVTPAERGSKLTAACQDADELRSARLLEEAAAVYGAIASVQADKRCQGTQVASGPGPPCDPLPAGGARLCDERSATLQRERTPREQTAGAWQAEVRDAQRRSEEQFERAEQYRRAYAMERAPGADAARGTALVRARNAYLLGLYIDPAAEDARRGLAVLLETLGATTRRRDADARCELAGRLFSAGLLPEARTAYAQALRSGRTTTCIRSGLLKLRWTRAWAIAKLRDATREQQAGATEGARADYIAAFVADSSQSDARKGLAAVPGAGSDDARTWSGAGTLASDGWTGVSQATGALQKNPESIAAAVALLGLMFLLLTLVLHQLARVRLLRAGLDVFPPLRRFTRTQVRREPFGPADDAHAALVTRVFGRAVREPPLRQQGAPEGTGVDVSPVATERARAGEVLPPLPSLQGLEVVTSWLWSLVPRQEIIVSGELLDADERGPGLSLSVFTRRNRPIAFCEFRHADILSSGQRAPKECYADLARYAAAWVIHRSLRPRSRGDWRPNGWFQVAVACQACGRHADAAEAYGKVLTDRRFVSNRSLLYNLAVCRIRAHRYDAALEALETLDRLTGQQWTPGSLVKRPYGSGYNRALALQYLAMKDEQKAVANYTKARDLMRVLLVPLLADSSDEAEGLKAPALMLHAGLLLSVADPREPGRLRAHSMAPEEVATAAQAVVAKTGKVPTCDALREAIQLGREQAEEIVAYVRHHFSGDHRATYNLACFEARLAGRDKRWRKPLLKLAEEDLADAVQDPNLAAWAPRDPALRGLPAARFAGGAAGRADSGQRQPGRARLERLLTGRGWWNDSTARPPSTA